MVTLGDRQATVQIVYLLSMYLVGRTLGQNTACTNVIQVVQVLSRITTQFVKVQLLQGFDGLAFQSYIIIIGGVDNGKLRFCIA